MNSTLEQISVYISDKLLFDKKVAKLHYFGDDKLVKRVYRWLDYFLEASHQAILYFESTVFVLLDASVSNRFFYHQTNYEVSLSLQFYNRLFTAKTNTAKIDYQTASVLFTTSLFYSKYYGLQQQSFKESFTAFKRGVNFVTSVLSFKKLFVKYEAPEVFLKNLDKFQHKEYAILAELLIGKNMRTIQGVPLPISKKESYVFFNCLPTHFKFQDNFLKRYIVASKILKYAPESTVELNMILNYSKIFQYNLDTFIEDLDFWVSIFKLLIKVNFKELPYGARGHIDYFEFYRYTLFAEFSFKGRTIRSINRLITQWHDRDIYSYNLSLLDKKWRKSSIPNYRTTYLSDEYYFKEIVTGKELYRESKTLEHCVYSYINSCLLQIIQIWSMRIKVNTHFSRLITIEINRGEIVQIAGKRNRKPTSKELKVIEEFTKFNGLKLAGHLLTLT